MLAQFPNCPSWKCEASRMKTISNDLRTHLDGTVTSLCSAWRMTRTDGTEFYFTDHDQDITFDDGDGSATYVSSTGYNRSAVANNVGLSVDNMDVEGVFDNDQIKEDELRAGLFDYAEIKVYVLNWADLTQGTLKMRRGRLGEVVITPQGIFRAELRGLTQLLSQKIVQPYQAECRVDLGSSACTIQIRPAVLERNAVVLAGEFYRVPTQTTAGITYGNLVQNKLFDQDTDDGAVTAVTGWTVASGDWAIKSTGGGLDPDEGDRYLKGGSINGSGELTQTVDLTLTALDLTVIDAGNATADFSIERANTEVDDTGRVLVSFLDASGSPLSALYDSGVEEITPEDTWTTRSAAAVAVPVNTRSIIVRLFHTEVTGPDSGAAFDNVSLTVTDTTTVPTLQEVYENRIYEVTTAGTTAGTLPVYDTTIANTTTDGTAVFTARDSYSRHGSVVDVVDRQNVTISVSEARAIDDWFNGGALILETGPNAGAIREIKDWTQSSGKIQLFLPHPFDIVPGDKVRIYPGCDKRLETCINTFDNVINFRGEPYVPGQDAISKTPNAH